MPSLSLPYASVQDLNTTLLGNVYSTPGYLGDADFSMSSGTTSASLSTPRDNSLCSPANINYGFNGTHRAPGGPITPEASAYSQLARYQGMERELIKEREDHASLKISFEKLLETNKMLTAALTGSAKRSRADDLESSADIPPGLSNIGSSSLPLPLLSRADFPLVKFWTKEEWETHRTRLKDASVPKSKGKKSGSEGLNTTALYVETEDGIPVSRATVVQIRAVARSVWIQLFLRGDAPESWGKASLQAKNLYYSELEKRWGFLRLCENHWKVDALATANYSQWYNSPSMAGHKATKDTDGFQAHAPKRSKTAYEDQEDLWNVRSEFTADPDDFDSLRSKTPMDALRVDDDQPSESETGATQDRGNISSRPKPRPLRDPLADVFDQTNATPFQVLARVPDYIPPTLPIGSSEQNVQNRVDPGGPTEDGRASTTTAPLPSPQIEPRERQRRAELAALRERSRIRREKARVTNETGEGSTTTTPVPALLDESGFPKRAISSVEVAVVKKKPEARRRKQREEQEPRDALANTGRDTEKTGECSTGIGLDSPEAGVPPVAVTVPSALASASSQVPGPSDNNLTELEVALANPNLPPEDRAFAQSAKFKNPRKMVPGDATTARRFCAEDWCARYPNGTEGQFKYYWETLDDKSLVEYKAIEKAQKSAKLATARAAKSATMTGESGSK